jgi:hypothetical protein
LLSVRERTEPPNHLTIRRPFCSRAHPFPRPALFDYYPIKSASGQKNKKNFWWPKIPKTTAFNNPAKSLMTGKRIYLAGIHSFRLGRNKSISSAVLLLKLGLIQLTIGPLIAAPEESGKSSSNSSPL